LRYLINEVLLRLIKPFAALLLGLLLYWVGTSLMAEPGSFSLFLACWVSAAVLILLLETGVI